MNETPMWIYRTALFCLPLVVAGYNLSVASAAALVLLMLLWRWSITLTRLILPARKQPELVLSSISASHFVEKVRWCLDRLGLAYQERPAGGTLGVFLTGRTVPVLKFKTGLVWSSIGNSAEILSYLWGRYSAELPEKAEFLKPSAERREFEHQLDRYGANLQVWVYYHILPHRQLTLKAWGAEDPGLPLYQRWMLQLCFPVQRFLIRKAFRISDINYAKAVSHIEKLLSDTETRISGNGASVLGDQEPNYTDFAFAAFSGLWLQPEAYGGGKARATRIEPEQVPNAMRADIQRWMETFPLSTAFVSSLYEEQRLPATD